MPERAMDAVTERPHWQDVAPDGHGGFWKRLLAYLIDWVILIAISIIVLLFGIVLLVAGGVPEVWAGPFGNLVGLLVGWIYYALFESSDWQATPGKRALDMKVVDMEGRRIGFWRATGRHFGKILSMLALLIGFVMIAFTREKQGLHDIMAGCLVINRRPPLDKRYLD